MPLIWAFLLQSAGDPAARAERQRPPMPSLPACPGLAQDQQFTTIAALPDDVRREIARFFGPEGGLAEAGGDFNATDMIENPATPQRRFLRGYREGDSWIIWYEYGGLGYHRQIITIRRFLRDGQVMPAGIVPRSNLAGDLCRATRASFDGVINADL